MPKDATTAPTSPPIPAQVLSRMATGPDEAWTPGDFADLGPRHAVDKALQRLEAAGRVSRIDRGIYMRPRISDLTGRPAPADYRAIIRAIVRRDKIRALVDGMTAANDLGLTTAVPAHIDVLVDARLRPIRLGNQQIRFRQAASSRLFWADRPAMRIVQALYWVHDLLDAEGQGVHVRDRLRQLLDDPTHGSALRDDLRDGWSTLPIWMQELLRDLVMPRIMAADWRSI